MRPAEKRAITFEASRCTRSDSQIPWDKVGIDYLSTQECMGEYGKVLVGVRVGALRESYARRRRTTHNNGDAENNNVGMTKTTFLLRKNDIFILKSIQNYIKKINTVLMTYRKYNAVSILFTTW